MQSNLKTLRNSAVMLFLLALFALPLIVNPVISLSFNDVFLNIKAIWILAVIFPAAAYLIYQNRGGVDQRVTWVSMFLFGWIMLADLINGRGWLNFTGAPDRLQGLPIYLTYGLVALATYLWSRRDSQAGEQFVKFSIWLAVPLGLYVALQYYGVVGILNGGASSGVAATVAGATLGNRGYLAGCMALLLPVTAATAARSRLGLILVTLVGFSLTTSMTRGALTAAFVGYMIWLIQGNAKQLGVHGALLLGLLLPFPHLTDGQAQLRWFGGNQQGVTDGGGRAPLWNTAMYGIQLRPVFGWGIGQLLDVMALRPDEQLLRELNIVPTERTVTRLPHPAGAPISWRVSGGGLKAERVSIAVNAVHNEYLECSFTFGLPAAAALLMLFVLGISRAWKQMPWAAASLAAYLVYLLTWPETVRFAPLAWAILGFALAASINALPSSRRTLPTT